LFQQPYALHRTADTDGATNELIVAVENSSHR
jgi:hypothetical protein